MTAYQTIQTRGARINYIDRGQVENPEIIYVFLHFWGGSSRTWDSVIDGLEQASGIRCIVLDQRGWGKSESLDERYDLDALADDVEDIATELKLSKYVLVGHSMGGKIAQIIADRTGTRPDHDPASSPSSPILSGLVLLGTAPPTPMPIPPEERATMFTSYQSRQGAEEAVSNLTGTDLGPKRERVIADILAGKQGAKSEWTDHGMTAFVTSHPPPLHFTGPVKVLVGEHDTVERPERSRAVFADYLPQAEVEMVPGVGHLLPIESPSAVISACRDIAKAL